MSESPQTVPSDPSCDGRLVCLDPGARIVEEADVAAVRFASAVMRQLLDDAKAGDEYLTELLSECYHYFPTSDADNGSYSDHVDRLAALAEGS